MKRSEMLDNIIDIIHLTRRATESWTTFQISEQLLKTIEQKGMLPPYNPIGSEPQEGHVMYCQWEPEDE